VAQSGQSFVGAGQYYLHDKLESQQRLSTDAKHAFNAVGDYTLHDKGDRQTAYRVGFTEILNMEARTPGEAIGQMTASYDRYREREKNKRGRKLTKPVYAYSLAWAPDQTPTREEMLSAAHSSLKALRLEGLQTLIVQHTDEPHPHIHVIVNRIEPEGLRARNIPFDQLRFSRWAEQYERDHGGIRCEQRVRNNELRRQGRMVRDTVSLTRTEYEARERAQREAMRPWRKVEDERRTARHKSEDAALTERHAREQAALEKRTHTRIRADQVAAKAKFVPNWRTLYREQDLQLRILNAANKGGIFERACFVFANRDFLAKGGRLRVRDLAKFCLSPRALTQRVRRVHEIERATMGKWERHLEKTATDIAWREHAQDFAIMRTRHALERDGMVYTQKNERENVQRERQPQVPIAPKREVQAPPMPELRDGDHLSPTQIDKLLQDAPKLGKSFGKAAAPPPEPPLSRADDIVRRMEKYKRDHPRHDFGRRRRR
jgi:hypothetical protein